VNVLDIMNSSLWTLLATTFEILVCAGGEFRTRDLQIMSIALVGEPLEFTKLTGTLTRLSYPGI